jgi:hypothetical protein
MSNVFSIEERRKAALLHPQKLTLLPEGAGLRA